MDSIVCLSHTGLFGIARIEFYSAIDGGFVYQQVLLIIWEINDGILVLVILGYMICPSHVGLSENTIHTYVYIYMQVPLGSFIVAMTHSQSFWRLKKQERRSVVLCPT